MAVLILKPSQDLTPIEHLLLNGGQAFEEINEDTADGDSSYLYQFINKTETIANSKFNFHCASALQPNISISRATLKISAKKTGDQTATVSVGGVLTLGTVDTILKEQALTKSHTFEMVAIDFTTEVKNYYANGNSISQDLPIKIVSKGIDTGKSGSSISITQSYFEIEYTINDNTSSVFIKQGQKWMEYKMVYKKVNKEWIQIDPNQIFNSLQSSTETKYVYGGNIK